MGDAYPSAFKPKGGDYAYLGPEGTNCNEVLNFLNIPEKFHVPFPTIPSVIQAVESGECMSGVVPIENSIEGSVPATIDALTFGSDLHIQTEVIMDICHCLVVADNIEMDDIACVTSHPQALAQCSRWLEENLPGRELRESSSTAEAIRKAVDTPGVAAIGRWSAANRYRGNILADGIEDVPENQTRFVVVGRGIHEKTGRDKTTLALFVHEDRPGVLLMILSEFAYAGINLTKIQSRPTKQQLGSYFFFVDLEGHIKEDNISLALECLKLKLREIKILGSYPAILIS